MFRAIAILVSFIGASAFAPPASSRMAVRSSLKMGYENEIGAGEPLGYFDPFSLSRDASAEQFAFYRAAEIKHGRVCQLAVLGYIAPETYRFPIDIAPGLPCSAVPNGIAAIEAIPALGWAQIIALIGFVDFQFTTYGSAGALTNKAGIKEVDAETQTKELNNGRLAMLATLELLRHDSQHLIGGMYTEGTMSNLITGLPFIYN